MTRLFWGIVLIAHFLKTYILVDNFDAKRDRTIEEEMKKNEKIIITQYAKLVLTLHQ